MHELKNILPPGKPAFILLPICVPVSIGMISQQAIFAFLGVKLRAVAVVVSIEYEASKLVLWIAVNKVDSLSTRGGPSRKDQISWETCDSCSYA
jgi:hypothetical protein